MVSGSISAAASAVRPRASSASAASAARTVTPHEACRPAVPGGPKTAERDIRSVLESGQLEQRVGFDHGQPHQGRAVSAARARACPRSSKANPSSAWPCRNGSTARRPGRGES